MIIQSRFRELWHAQECSSELVSRATGIPGDHRERGRTSRPEDPRREGHRQADVPCKYHLEVEYSSNQVN